MPLENNKRRFSVLSSPVKHGRLASQSAHSFQTMIKSNSTRFLANTQRTASYLFFSTIYVRKTNNSQEIQPLKSIERTSIDCD